MNKECEKIVKHLSRIQGQITALKEYIEETRSCEDVAHLLKSITTSFASVRTDIVEAMIFQQLTNNTLSEKKRPMIRSIVSVLQK